MFCEYGLYPFSVEGFDYRKTHIFVSEEELREKHNGHGL